MKRRVRGLQRILKVRDAQKRLKSSALMRAGNHCSSLESNAQRIKSLYAETRQNDVAENADLFAAKLELSDRLLEASRVLDVSIQTARQDFSAAERQSFAARRVHDGTEKLLKSKVSTLRKAEVFQTDVSNNILYNIGNIRKKERRNDW